MRRAANEKNRLALHTRSHTRTHTLARVTHTRSTHPTTHPVWVREAREEKKGKWKKEARENDILPFLKVVAMSFEGEVLEPHFSRGQGQVLISFLLSYLSPTEGKFLRYPGIEQERVWNRTPCSSHSHIPPKNTHPYFLFLFAVTLFCIDNPSPLHHNFLFCLYSVSS